MEPLTIKAVEMTRHIRDQHAEALQGKTPAEIMAFFQQKAEALHTQLHLSSDLPQGAAESQAPR